MFGHTIKEWFFALRPWSFPASLTPVVATLGALYWRNTVEPMELNWTNGALAALGMVVFQGATNLISDYFDFRQGVDREDTFGSPNLTGGQFTPREIALYGLFVLLVGCAIGLILVWRTDARLLIPGICGVVFVVAYAFFKFRALGDAVVFCIISVLPTLGTTLVVTGRYDWNCLIVALPIGMITVGILHANNWRDVQTDSRANIKTLCMFLGSTGSEIVYIFELMFPFLWLALAALVFHWIPAWTLLSLCALPLAFKALKNVVYRADNCEAIADLDVLTAQILLVFGVLLTFSFILAAWL